MASHTTPEAKVSITPLLKRLWPAPKDGEVTAVEIAAAISHIFTDSLSPVQTGALLTALHFTNLDRKSDVLGACALAMRNAAVPVDTKALVELVKSGGRKEGGYKGGFCDIVGTGGDSHNTFNISTTASVIASSLLLVAKHGNRASTSKSGSADLLANAPPKAPILDAVKPDSILEIYQKTNYAFLFAPVFHPGMRFVAPVRKELGWRTIFNLLGPLSHPFDSRLTAQNSDDDIKPENELLEARIIGVARKDLGEAFALAIPVPPGGRAMVVCGDEDLDELSCAGPTHCWYTTYEKGELMSEKNVAYFTLSPSDFGLPTHPLDTVGPGKTPQENAAIFMQILRGEVNDDDPVLHFVLINTAALLVVSGICDADTSNMSEGDDCRVIQERGPGNKRWKEGVRRARWAIKSGAALKQWQGFVDVTNDVQSRTS